MWIKEVILDGFKSYATRTVISGWDPSFNAITGLNGSGKSNILDAICFVLGISVLSQVRVSSLQELVYKQGQARVTKASVSIVFDNRDKRMSPVGYEHLDEIHVTRQVVIGGRNKYLINGHTAQLSKVQNLFHSVQLNVNNPHFLIMQGRITKVINMKPPEILGMMEEAAGTRMYETKKRAAQKTIQKKQGKVVEIDQVVKDELQPKLEKLKKEKQAFMQWQANTNEIEVLSRFIEAWKYYDAQKQIQEAAAGQDAAEAEVVRWEEEKARAEADAKRLAQSIRELEVQREEELKSALAELEEKVTARSKELIKETATFTNAKDALDADVKERDQIAASIAELNASMRKKEGEVGKARAAREEAEKRHATLEQHLASLQGSLLGFAVAGDEKKEQGSLAAQLMEAQRQASAAESEGKQLAMRATRLKESAADKRRAARAAEKDHSTLSREHDKKAAELKRARGKLEEMRFDPDARQPLEAKLSAAQQQEALLRDRCAQFRAQLAASGARFEFADPERNFDRSRVKGTVAQLIELVDFKGVELSGVANAIEVAAGARLYNVVVDAPQTARLLLERSGLKRRTTFIPLSNIDQRTVPAERLARACQLVGEENVWAATELIKYSREVAPAMLHVFGGTLVCRDAHQAERVCFDRQVNTRVVTLEGDVFEPRGTLSGGTRSKASLLTALQQLSDGERQLRILEDQIKVLKSQLAAQVRAEEGAREYTSAVQLLTHDLSLLSRRLEESNFAQLSKEADAIEAQLAQVNKQAEDAQKAREAAEKRSRELEREIKDFESERKNKVARVEQELASGKKELVAVSKEMKKAQQAAEHVSMELTQMGEEVKAAEVELETRDARLAKARKDLSKLEAKVADFKAKYDEVKSLLDAEKEKLSATDKRLSKLNKERSRLSKMSSDAEVELRKASHKLQRLVSDQKDAKARLEVQAAKHEWIQAEKHLFGKPHTDYDFEKNSPKAAAHKLSSLKSEQEQLSKKINKKVLGMVERTEQECTDLLSKRAIIERDKTKIEEVIEELDRKKNEALETTWKKVTRDFGSIFSTLLPGAKAKLEPAGRSIHDGLEVRVAFGNTWKESLSELSGGQRSLLALSLILALLLFKPAPMYILDEIDAALDLSHTQNIGQMLKTHFPQSQFIVVSLKEGMFNNANVVFRTKFVDGVSAVSRTALAHNKGQKRKENTMFAKAAAKMEEEEKD